MSFHHENVVWQSEDGRWNIGFFKRIPGDISDPDYDAEWDDFYDYQCFEFVSTGHLAPETARAAWRGANPGIFHEVPYAAENREELEDYEDLAAEACEREQKGRGTSELLRGTSGYEGPPKARSLRSLKKERDATLEKSAFDLCRGVTVSGSSQATVKALDSRIEKMLPHADEAQWEGYEHLDRVHRHSLQRIIDSSEDDRARRARANRKRGTFSPSEGERMGRQRQAEEQVRSLLDDAEAEAKKRRKARKKASRSAVPPPAQPQRPGAAVPHSRGAGRCGRPTRSGKPCLNSSNCPVHS